MPDTPPPPGWDRTVDDLMAELDRGERISIDGEKLAWARDYERSLLPPDTVFPVDGEVWEAIDDVRVNVSYLYAAPVGNSGHATLSRGERVRVDHFPPPPAPPIYIDFVPVRYDELLETLVPAGARGGRFTGYHLSVKTVYFNQHFRRVAEAPPGRRRSMHVRYPPK